MPPSCKPRTVMNDAQGAQWFNQFEFSPVELGDRFIAIQQGIELTLTVSRIAAEQHPEILHGWAHAGIVQINEMWAIRCPEDVAWVAVPMDASQLQSINSVKGLLAQIKCLIGSFEPFVPLFYGQAEFIVAQPKPGLTTRLLNAHCWPLREGATSANQVQAGEEAPKPGQHLRVFQFWRTAAATRADGDAMALEMPQGRRLSCDSGRAICRLQDQWRHRRYLSCHEFLAEAVLFQNLSVVPATGAVELGDHEIATVQANLEYAVFVGVQLQQPSVHGLPQRFKGIKNKVGREVGVGRVGVHAPSYRSEPGLLTTPDDELVIDEVHDQATASQLQGQLTRRHRDVDAVVGRDEREGQDGASKRQASCQRARSQRAPIEMVTTTESAQDPQAPRGHEEVRDQHKGQDHDTDEGGKCIHSGARGY